VNSAYEIYCAHQRSKGRATLSEWDFYATHSVLPYYQPIVRVRDLDQEEIDQERREGWAYGE
jgi:hypothetical protein